MSSVEDDLLRGREIFAKHIKDEFSPDNRYIFVFEDAYCLVPALKENLKEYEEKIKGDVYLILREECTWRDELSNSRTVILTGNDFDDLRKYVGLYAIDYRFKGGDPFVFLVDETSVGPTVSDFVAMDEFSYDEYVRNVLLKLG